MRFLYRGVHAFHPALADARKGIVRPADVESTLSAEEHNRDGFSDRSPYTSWSSDKAVALKHAQRKGPGGILLTVPVGSAESGEGWKWEYSPDRWLEDEILLRGVRLNVEATEV
jgi:hypothetical protein